MQVTVEDVSSVKKIVHVKVSEDRVVKDINDAYKELKKTAKIKGFRPGKAPLSVLKRMFKKDVHKDVALQILQDTFPEAVNETGLDFIGEPAIENPVLNENEPYEYTATMEIKPEIEEIDFKDLKLRKHLYRITNEEMDAQLKMLQKNLAQHVAVTADRGAQDGDFVSIDYEGFKDGKSFVETQKTENFTMKIGEGKISKEIDEQLINMKPGEEKQITVNFPEDYFNNKLARQNIVFHVKLNEIRKEVLPEIDDLFAAQLGPYKTLDDLKKEITDNLNQGYKQRVEQELNEQVFKALIEKTEFEIPDSMVEFELGNIIDEIKKTLSYYNKTMEEENLSEETLREKHRNTAEKKAKRHLILDKIIKQENLTLTDEEIEEGLSGIANNVNQPVESIKSFYEQNEKNYEFFKHTLLEKRAIKLIIENSTIEEVEPELQENDSPS